MAGTFAVELTPHQGAKLVNAVQAAFIASYAAPALGGGFRWDGKYTSLTGAAEGRGVAVGGDVHLGGFALSEGFRVDYPTAGSVPLSPLVMAGAVQVLGVAAAGGTSCLAGGFAGTAPIAPDGSTRQAAGLRDLFVRCDKGSWVKTIGSSGDDAAYAIAIDQATGNVYAAGQLGGVVDGVGPGVVVAGWDASGVPLPGFPRSSGSITDEARGLALAPNGKALYLVGTFASAKLGFGSTALTCQGATDAFLLKLAL